MIRSYVDILLRKRIQLKVVLLFFPFGDQFEIIQQQSFMALNAMMVYQAH